MEYGIMNMAFHPLNPPPAGEIPPHISPVGEGEPSARLPRWRGIKGVEFEL